MNSSGTAVSICNSIMRGLHSREVVGEQQAQIAMLCLPWRGNGKKKEREEKVGR
jgi:hypothetical protein